MVFRIILLSIVFVAISGCASCVQPSNEPVSIPDKAPWLTFTLEDEPQVVTLDEAAQAIGTKIPVPSYLPDNYAIQEVLIVLSGQKKNKKPILIISEKPVEIKIVEDSESNSQGYEVRCRLALEYKIGEGLIPIRLEDKDKVKLNTVKGKVHGDGGWIFQYEDYKYLLWTWYPDINETEAFEFEMELNAPKGFSNEEMVKVAESTYF
jgi:hypothetical protein